MKNILVITGSPRHGGNSDALADSFIKGAKQAGHTVHKFESAFKIIQGCKACDSCWSNSEPCVFDDDFLELAPQLETADAIVFVTPVYWFGMSAQIKLAIDKFYAYARPNCPNKLKVKESCLIACAGDSEQEVFNGTVETYKGIVNYMQWKDRGIITVADVYVPGDVNKGSSLEAAEKLGRSI